MQVQAVPQQMQQQSPSRRFTQAQCLGLKQSHAVAMVHEFRQRGIMMVGFARKVRLRDVAVELAERWPKGVTVLVLPVW